MDNETSIRKEFIQAFHEGFEEGSSGEFSISHEALARGELLDRLNQMPEMLKFGDTWVWVVKSMLKENFTYMPLDINHIILAVPRDYRLTDERVKNIRESTAKIVLHMSGVENPMKEVSPEDPRFN